MSGRRNGRTPRTQAEWVRDISQRMTAVERSSTTRIGPWALTVDSDGEIIATKPGQALAVGQEPAAPRVTSLSRGYVTPQAFTAVVMANPEDPETPNLPAPLVEVSNWFHDRWNDLTSTVENFVGLFSGLSVPNADGLVADLLGTRSTATDALGNIQDTWDRIWRGGRPNDPAATGKTVDDVQTIIEEQRELTLTAQNSAITLANLANQPANVPFWVSPNPFEEVAFPRSELTTRTVVSTPTLSDGAGSAAHTHEIDVSYVGQPILSLNADTLYLNAVRVTQDRIINEVGILSAGATPTASAIYVGFYQIDPATGDLTLLYDWGDVKGDMEIGPDIYDQRWQLPEDLLAGGGEMYAVGVLSVGAAFTVAGTRRQKIITGYPVFPRAASERLIGQSSLPTSISETDLDHDSTYRVWASIGQTFGTDDTVTLLEINETFNYSTVSRWVSPSWSVVSNSIGMSISDDGTVSVSYPGNTTFIDPIKATATYVKPLNTNDNGVEITIGSGWVGTTYGIVALSAFVRCNVAKTSGVVMDIDYNGATAARVRLYSYGPGSAKTLRATSTGSLRADIGDKFTIEAVGNVYTAYRNGVAIPAATWTDSGGVVSIGKAWRRHGFGLGARNLVFAVWHRVAGVTNYRAFDIAS